MVSILVGVPPATIATEQMAKRQKTAIGRGGLGGGGMRHRAPVTDENQDFLKLVSLIRQFQPQPTFGICPVFACCRRGDIQNLRGLLNRQPGKKTQFDQFRLAGINAGKFLQHFVQCQDIESGIIKLGFEFRHIQTMELSGAEFAYVAPFRSGSADGFGSRRKEMAPIIPSAVRIGAHQTQIRFMNQRGRLQCLSWASWDKRKARQFHLTKPSVAECLPCSIWRKRA